MVSNDVTSITLLHKHTFIMVGSSNEKTIQSMARISLLVEAEFILAAEIIYSVSYEIMHSLARKVLWKQLTIIG